MKHLTHWIIQTFVLIMIAILYFSNRDFYLSLMPLWLDIVFIITFILCFIIGIISGFFVLMESIYNYQTKSLGG